MEVSPPLMIRSVAVHNLVNKGKVQHEHQGHSVCHTNTIHTQTTPKNTKFRLGSFSGKTWRPDAPEFVPQSAKSNISTTASSSSLQGKATPEGKPNVSSSFDLIVSISSVVGAHPSTDTGKKVSLKTNSTPAVPIPISGRGFHKKWKRDRGSRKNTANESTQQGNLEPTNPNLTRQTTLESPALQDAKESTIEWPTESPGPMERPKRRHSLFRHRNSRSEPTVKSPHRNIDGASDESTEYVSDEECQSNLQPRSQRNVSTPAGFGQENNHFLRSLDEYDGNETHKQQGGMSSQETNESEMSGICPPLSSPAILLPGVKASPDRR